MYRSVRSIRQPCLTKPSWPPSHRLDVSKAPEHTTLDHLCALLQTHGHDGERMKTLLLDHDHPHFGVINLGVYHGFCHESYHDGMGQSAPNVRKRFKL
jgi:hypothetical protein